MRVLPLWEQRDCCHRKDFHEISCFVLLLNFVNNFQFAFKVLTKKEYLTQIPTHVRAICLYNTDNVLCEARTEYNSWQNRYLVWCGFDRASSLICGNKMPTRCNRGFYCRSYCLLNMFRAPPCPSSGAREYYIVVAACGISCCGFSNLKTTARNTTGSNHCIILSSSWWWA